MKSKRKTRAYKMKESFKWERASRHMAQRLGGDPDNVSSVCDREADIIEYLTYKTTHKQRFVVSSTHNRRIEQSTESLYTFSCALKSAGDRVVGVKQRGGRKERKATCEVKYAPVTIKMPSNKEGESISLYCVSCKELNHDKPLCWHILTSEPVLNAKDAKQILDYYEKRWLIEEFQKHGRREAPMWKSFACKAKTISERWS